MCHICRENPWNYFVFCSNSNPFPHFTFYSIIGGNERDKAREEGMWVDNNNKTERDNIRSGDEQLEIDNNKYGMYGTFNEWSKLWFL